MITSAVALPGVPFVIAKGHNAPLVYQARLTHVPLRGVPPIARQVQA
jgi:hypothetical protein